MSLRNTPVKITASYQTCCFCDLPKLEPGTPFSTQARFEFKQQALSYADQHGMTIQSWGKYKTALAVLPVKCSHRDEQYIRLDWTLA